MTYSATLFLRKVWLIRHSQLNRLSFNYRLGIADHLHNAMKKTKRCDLRYRFNPAVIHYSH